LIEAAIASINAAGATWRSDSEADLALNHCSAVGIYELDLSSVRTIGQHINRAGAEIAATGKHVAKFHIRQVAVLIPHFEMLGRIPA
jgi:hypothetical protein